MIGPQLQKAVYDRVKALAGGRVYDRVAPAGPDFPYLTIGDEQVVDDGTQCSDMFEVFTDVHVWSRAGGRVEAKQIGEDVRQLMMGSDLTVDDYSVIIADFENSRVLTDPDGITAHAILTFRFLLQPE